MVCSFWRAMLPGAGARPSVTWSRTDCGESWPQRETSIRRRRCRTRSGERALDSVSTWPRPGRCSTSSTKTSISTGSAEVQLLDVNVILAAHRRDHPHHGPARTWIEALLEHREPFGAPVWVWVSFVREATTREIWNEPSTIADAFRFVRAMQLQPGWVHVDAGAGHLGELEALCRAADASGALLPDASLAATAISLGCRLASFDGDFARFPGLDWLVPEA